MSILIVGSVALDSIQTPLVKGDDVLGGAAVHGALAARQFAPVEIVGVVGDDFPRKHIALLRRHGVGLEGLEAVKGGRTFRWGGRYFDDINKRETLFTELNVFENFQPKVAPRSRRLPFVFLANINPELQLQVLEQCQRPRFVMVDTMNLWIDIRREALVEVLRRCDLVLMNDEEARQFAGVASLQKAARAILRLGCKRVIIKKGEHGSIMFSSKGYFAVPGAPLPRVVDPTGAGDTFAGGFIGWMARKGSLSEETARQGIVAGTALASFCVEDLSVRRIAKLKTAELRERIRQIAQAIACPPIRF